MDSTISHFTQKRLQTLFSQMYRIQLVNFNILTSQSQFLYLFENPDRIAVKLPVKYSAA